MQSSPMSKPLFFVTALATFMIVVSILPTKSIAEDDSKRIIFNRLQQTELRLDDLLYQLEQMYVELQKEKQHSSQMQKILEDRISALEKIILTGEGRTDLLKASTQSQALSTTDSQDPVEELSALASTKNVIDGATENSEGISKPQTNPLANRQSLVADDESEGKRAQGLEVSAQTPSSLDQDVQEELASPNDIADLNVNSMTTVEENAGTLAENAVTTTETTIVKELPASKDIILLFSQKKQEAEYEMTFELLLNREYALATYGFKKYLEEYPNSALSPLAAYWLAEAYYVQGQYETALAGYDRVLTTYPDSDRIGESLFKKGMCLIELRRTDEAKDVFNQVIYEYPDATIATLARNELDKLP